MGEVVCTHNTKAHRGSSGTAPVILNLSRWVITFMPWRLYPWYPGWVGPRASLGSLDKRKISCCCQIWTLDCTAFCLVTILTELSQLSLSVKFLSSFYEWYKYLLCRLTEFHPSTHLPVIKRKTHHNKSYQSVLFKCVYTVCVHIRQ